MSKEGYISLPEIESQSIRSRLVLPFHLEEQIGINVKKTERLAQLGGIRSVTIKNDSSGEKSKIVPTVVGMNRDGSAMSGAIKTEYVPISGLDIKQDRNKDHNARWADIAIKINTEELQARLLHTDKVVSKPNAWAPDLNNIMHKELRKAGNKQLLQMIPMDYFGFLWMYGWSIYFVTRDNISHPHLPAVATALATRYIINGFLWNTLNTIHYGMESRGIGSRRTLGIGPELDRAAIFNLSFLGKPLIKDLTQKAK